VGIVDTATAWEPLDQAETHGRQRRLEASRRENKRARG
jgi:hypothetical protein